MLNNSKYISDFFVRNVISQYISRICLIFLTIYFISLLCNAGKYLSSQLCQQDPKNSLWADRIECFYQQQAIAIKEVNAFGRQFHETICSHYLKASNSNVWKQCALFDTYKEFNSSLLNQEECQFKYIWNKPLKFEFILTMLKCIVEFLNDLFLQQC